MNLELAVQVGTLVSLAVAAASLYFASQSFRRQMNAQVYLTYTERYERIMSSLPHDAWKARFNLTDELPEPSNELTFSVLKYLNLISEEYYLYRGGYLAWKVWTMWECELKRTINSRLIHREWKHLRHEFDSYPEFQKYVDKVQRKGEPKSEAFPMRPVWYSTGDNKDKQGPFTIAQIKEFAKAGSVQPSFQAWKVGTPKWIEARLIPGLLDEN